MPPDQTILAVRPRSAFVAMAVLLGAFLSVLSGSLGAQERALVDEVSFQATLGNGQRKLVRDASGTLYAIYVAPHEGADSIFVGRSDDGGTSWYQDTLLSRAGIRAGLGSLTFDQSGTLHASWVDYETVGHVWHASRTDAWSDSMKISPGPEYAGFPAMVADQGGVHVLWYGAKPNEAYSHGSEYEIRHTYLTDSGWSVPDLVSVGSFDALNPTAADGPGDSVFAAWYQKSGEFYRANAAVWTGTGWDVPKTVSPAAGNAVSVSMDVGPDGTVHLVWQQFLGDIPRIAYAAYAAGTWTTPEYLTPGSASNPVVAAERDGRVVVAWSGENGIEMRRRAGSWGSPVALGPGDYPTLLPGDPVSVMWTRPRGSGHELAFAAAAFSGGPPIVVIVILALAAVGGVATLLRRRTAR
jgi:hypothetical protein